eukprot:Seg1936.3 transcript_id=Seg1936.3/GoldUCD/mRNA.D3Y31 product="Platelet-activating factor receptor" protein_id=Seg1936.3/GoldUCD/D3Y31
MANITGSTSSPSTIQAASTTVFYITLTFTIAVLAIILNGIEIHMIRRKWKKATDFEVLLLNLGIADLLSGIGYVVIASLRAVAYATKSSSAGHSLVLFGILAFFSSASVKLVFIIGFERLFAIKLPLKHRLWHTNRNTLYKRVIAVWIVTFIFIISAVLSDYLIRKSKGQKAIVSRNLGYALATYLTLGIFTVAVTYIWLSHIVIKRATKLLNFDKKDYKQSPKAIIKAVKNEKATIIICRLVAATFFVCNIPIVVALYRAKLDIVSVSLTNLNAVINPLIYFFKGYAERWYAKKKLAVSSSDTGGSNDNLDSPSLKETKSETSLGMKKLNQVKDDNLTKMNGKGSVSSNDEGERPMNQFDATHKLGNENLSRPEDPESERPRSKHDERLNSLPSSEEKEAETIAGNGDLCIEYDEDSRSSKDRGQEQCEVFIKKIDLFVDAEQVDLVGNSDLCVENDQESKSSKVRGEEQGEILANNIDLFVDVETVNVAQSGDLCTVRGPDFEGSNVKGECSLDKPDSTVRINSANDNEQVENLKATGPNWSTDRLEATQL